MAGVVGAKQLVTVLAVPVLMPVPALPLACTPSTRQLFAIEVPRSTPSSPQLRTEPLTTAMFVRPFTVTLTPSKPPIAGMPTRSKPLRSSVTPLETISMPCLPTTPVMLPVR